MRKFLLLVVLGLFMLFMTAEVYAGCTLGAKDCRDGYWWYCESCGSETCWIFKGIKCTVKKSESNIEEQLAMLDEGELLVVAYRDCNQMKNCPD